MIDCPIGFHPHVREKMAIRRDDPESRPAQTFYEVVERFDGFAAVRVAAEDRAARIRSASTWTTSAARCSATGNTAAAAKSRAAKSAAIPTDELVLLDRQALHARRLRFAHPATGEPMEVEAPLPADMQAVLGGTAQPPPARREVRGCPELSSPFGRGAGGEGMARIHK